MIPKLLTSQYTDMDKKEIVKLYYLGGTLLMMINGWSVTKVWLSDAKYPDLRADDRFMYYVEQPQTHKVVVKKKVENHNGTMLDFSDLFKEILEFLFDTRSFWSVELTVDDENDTIVLQFSFSDLSTAVLFRFKFQ
jgi:hypothetical protein